MQISTEYFKTLVNKKAKVGMENTCVCKEVEVFIHGEWETTEKSEWEMRKKGCEVWKHLG